MPTAVGYFQIANQGDPNYIGGFTTLNQGDVRTGLLVKANTTNQLSPCAATDVAAGIALSNRTLIYRPLAAFLDIGEPVTLVNGHIFILVDSTYFLAGTIPAVNVDLYTGAGGLLSTTVSAGFKVGKTLMAQDTIRNVPNTTSNIIMVELHIAAA